MPGFVALDRDGSVINYKSAMPGVLGTLDRQRWLNEQNQKLQGDYASYWKNYADEVNRYWADYYKNTGYTPRYPYKAGLNNSYGLSSLGSTYGSIGYSIANENLAYQAFRSLMKNSRMYVNIYA